MWDKNRLYYFSAAIEFYQSSNAFLSGKQSVKLYLMYITPTIIKKRQQTGTTTTEKIQTKTPLGKLY